jgi:hypothetical protein
MVKKSSATKKRMTAKRSKKNKLPDLNWRPIIILGVATVAGLVFLTYSLTYRTHAPDARGVADKFVQAFRECDSATVEKYAPLMAADEKKMARFRQDCKPGVLQFTFFREKTFTSNDAESISYKVHDPTQQTFKDYTLILTMTYLSAKEGWVVAFVNGFPTSQ